MKKLAVIGMKILKHNWYGCKHLFVIFMCINLPNYNKFDNHSPALLGELGLC